jgi:diphthamide biosynthesis protein 7
MKYTDLLEFDTKLTADVVEWIPDLIGQLSCGTYYYDKSSLQRTGCLYVLKLNEKFDSIEKITNFEFTHAGILDLKWLNSTSLVTIDSKNCLKLIRYDSESFNLNVMENIELNENAIGLSIDVLDQKIASVDNQGNINTILMSQEKFSLEKSFKAHDAEVWSIHNDRFDSNVLYSGADDCLLKMWDFRKSTKRAINESNVFEAGVCSILTPSRNSKDILSGFTENNILCGSYDERIYLLDKRNMKKCVSKSEKLQGGVWKMKLSPFKNYLICACMHTGLNIVNLEGLKLEMNYEKHGLDNLAYGCDIYSKRVNKIEANYDLIASCSFYNHNLRVWKLEYDTCGT